MDVFQEVLQRSDIIRVCDMLGIKLNRSNQCLCPFSSHNEKTPSFSVSQTRQMFKCFGCGKGGNSINLVAEMYGVKNLEAAKIINRNLGLGIEFRESGVKIKKASQEIGINKYEATQKNREALQKWEFETMKTLCTYAYLLKKWEKEENWKSNLYAEAINYKEYIDLLIDNFFIDGTAEDKKWFWKNKRKEMKKYESRVREYRRMD